MKLTGICASPYTTPLFALSGQVAQLVERGPEKAGVGGSIPSLATNTFNNLASLKNRKIFSRAQYAHLQFRNFTFGPARSSNPHGVEVTRIVDHHIYVPKPIDSSFDRRLSVGRVGYI